MLNELTIVENDIANARKYYNGTVREFNTLIETFPFNLIANVFHYEQKEMFSITDVQRQEIKVDL